jgi:hypothetical protein
MRGSNVLNLPSHLVFLGEAVNVMAELVQLKYLLRKNEPAWKRFSRIKRSSLLSQSVNYTGKSFMIPVTDDSILSELERMRHEKEELEWQNHKLIERMAKLKFILKGPSFNYRSQTA